jgi:hypothetical protein
LDQLPEKVEELKRAGRLQQNGRSAEALPILDQVLATATDPTPGRTRWSSASAR